MLTSKAKPAPFELTFHRHTDFHTGVKIKKKITEKGHPCSWIKNLLLG